MKVCLVYVKRCADCPRYSRGLDYCDFLEKDIVNPEEIDEECPLEDE